MRRVTLMLIVAITVLFSGFCISTANAAEKCYRTKPSHQALKPIALIGGRQFFGTFDDRTDSRRMAQELGLCVQEFGIRLLQIDPKTKEGLRWEIGSGYSVWEELKGH